MYGASVIESRSVAKQMRTTEIRHWDASPGSDGCDNTKHQTDPRNIAQMAVLGTLDDFNEFQNNGLAFIETLQERTHLRQPNEINCSRPRILGIVGNSLWGPPEGLSA